MYINMGSIALFLCVNQAFLGSRITICCSNICSRVFRDICISLIAIALGRQWAKVKKYSKFFLMLNIYTITFCINSTVLIIGRVSLCVCSVWTVNTSSRFSLHTQYWQNSTLRVLSMKISSRVILHLRESTVLSIGRVSLYVHRKKKVREFPVPRRDITVKLSLGGNNDVITELFLPRGSLVSDIPARDGKLVNLFLRCMLSMNTSSRYISSPYCKSTRSMTLLKLSKCRQKFIL
jgi:hypothetical protein